MVYFKTKNKYLRLLVIKTIYKYQVVIYYQDLHI